jgi:hypothetical protein
VDSLVVEEEEDHFEGEMLADSVVGTASGHLLEVNHDLHLEDYEPEVEIEMKGVKNQRHL